MLSGFMCACHHSGGEGRPCRSPAWAAPRGSCEGEPHHQGVVLNTQIGIVTDTASAVADALQPIICPIPVSFPGDSWLAMRLGKLSGRGLLFRSGWSILLDQAGSKEQNAPARTIFRVTLCRNWGDLDRS